MVALSDRLLAALNKHGGVLLPAVSSLLDEQDSFYPITKHRFTELQSSNELLYNSRQDERLKLKRVLTWLDECAGTGSIDNSVAVEARLLARRGANEPAVTGDPVATVENAEAAATIREWLDENPTEFTIPNTAWGRNLLDALRYALDVIEPAEQPPVPDSPAVDVGSTFGYINWDLFGDDDLPTINYWASCRNDTHMGPNRLDLHDARRDVEEHMREDHPGVLFTVLSPCTGDTGCSGTEHEDGCYSDAPSAGDHNE